MPSLRVYPERVTAPLYPAHMEVRRVSTAGTFRLHARQPFLSQALRNEYIGLEEVADGIWNIVYYSTLLGKIDERSLLITGVSATFGGAEGSTAQTSGYASATDRVTRSRASRGRASAPEPQCDFSAISQAWTPAQGGGCGSDSGWIIGVSAVCFSGWGVAARGRARPRPTVTVPPGARGATRTAPVVSW